MIPVENIPARLKQIPQWVGWKYVERDGKPTKCPVNPATGGMADSTDPVTWGTFEQAMAAYQSDSLAGVGFVFTTEANLCGVDLDDSVDPSSGELKPWACRVVNTLDSYTEISPSGRGVKVFLRARKPGSRCRKACEDGEVEVYDCGRFFTVTGRRVENVSDDVADRQAQLDEVYTAIFGPAERAPMPALPALNPVAPQLTDEEIIRKASRSRRSGQKFGVLWAGRWNDHFNSPSEADSSVIFTLAFYTKDPVQIDRIFRRSGLMRDKWDEYHGAQTYGEMTIAKALEKVAGQYVPRKRAKKAGRKPATVARPPSIANLPQIVITDVQLADLTGQGLGAIRRANVPPAVFVRSGSLCRVTRDEDGQSGIDQLDKVKVRSRLAESATFYTINKRGDYVSANPPLYLAENILAQGAWDFPPLVGVARSPILRHDGTICTTPGYDAESRLYYCPDPNLIVPPIPDEPSLEEVEAARDQLVDLVEEFPFADSAGLANALAILLSILMRPVISGHVPLAIVDAPMQGTGKTLMVSALGIVGVGMVSGESVPDRQNDDEWRKKIT